MQVAGCGFWGWCDALLSRVGFSSLAPGVQEATVADGDGSLMLDAPVAGWLVPKAGKPDLGYKLSWVLTGHGPHG